MNISTGISLAAIGCLAAAACLQPAPADAQGTYDPRAPCTPWPACAQQGQGQSSEPGEPSAPVQQIWFYGAVAYHPDASDVWVSARYLSRGAAEKAARDACSASMGRGCETVWQGEGGYLGVAKSADGNMHWVVEDSRRKVQERLEKRCQPSVLGCAAVNIFSPKDDYRSGRQPDGSGSNIRYPKDVANLRNRYGAVAWAIGKEYAGTSWLASGHVSLDRAQEAALSACRAKHPRSSGCTLAVAGSNGTIIAYTRDDGDHAFMFEQGQARAEKAIASVCKKAKRKCTVSSVHDARASGLKEVRMP